MYPEYQNDLEYVKIVPAKRQVRLQQMEFYGFVHFTVNTFTDREWGDGTENPEIFNPELLDCNQWVEAVKSAGMTGLILTAKHHDGFCLWPSAYTEHSVKNSPYKNGHGDIVKECSEACRRGGIRFGVYLSPWDRNCPVYGQGKAYDDYYCNQLTELLTNYGDIFSVWFDGCCGEGPNGKKQVYDWERYYSVIRSLQPDACISVSGPDIRWCGNEAGDTRKSEWSVITRHLSDGTEIEDTSEDLGSRALLEKAAEICWQPAEVDTSIRPGWFYHKNEDAKVRSVKTLSDIYFRSVGGNSTLLLNIPPDKNGLFAKPDVKKLKQLGDRIRKTFEICLSADAIFTADRCDGKNLIENVKTDSYDTCFKTNDGENSVSITITLPEKRKIHLAVIKENILFSQRIEGFTIDCAKKKGFRRLYEGTTVGYKRIARFRPTVTDTVRITITDSRVAPVISHIALY